MTEENQQLKAIADLAKRQLKCEEAVATAKAALEAKVGELKYVAETLLPNAMAEAEMSAFTLDNGATVTVKREYATSISVDNFPAAKAWLKEHDGDGIIKHVVSLSFGKDENEAAEAALTLLMEKGYTPEDKESIHPQTLKAAVKSYIQSGKDLPMDVFGVFEMVKSVVKLPK
jgi:hypothetical protein